MKPSNLRKLKAAYRHPFEYINPRLYQKKDQKTTAEIVDETTQAKFFVDNEDEFLVLQGANASTTEASSTELHRRRRN